MILGNCLYCKSSFRKREQKYKFCSLKCSSNYNLNGLRVIKLPKQSEELAELVGIILGDGDITKYQVKVTLNSIVDKEYSIFVKKLFGKLFPDITPFVRERKGEGCTVVGISSRIAADFFKEMGVVSWKPLVPPWIFNKDAYLIACIRGLIDTEGSIGFKAFEGKRKKTVYRQLAFTSGNYILLEFIRDGLTHLGLKCTQSLTKNIYLSNDSQIDYYRNLIQFHNQKLEQRSLIRNYLSYKKWRGVRAV